MRFLPKLFDSNKHYDTRIRHQIKGNGNSVYDAQYYHEVLGWTNISVYTGLTLDQSKKEIDTFIKEIKESTIISTIYIKYP